MPVATFNTIRFRYPLKIFQKYQLKTKIIWWDDTIFYFEQTFERKGRTLATGHICGTLFDKKGKVPSEVIIKETGQSVIKPDKPRIIGKLREIENLIHESQKDKQ